MKYIPKLNCPTCGDRMIGKEENDQPVWYHPKEDGCPCMSIKGFYKNE